jgi:hypothetical protein
MTDVHKLTLQVQAPKGRFPGKIEIGYWCVADQCVVLCDENGRPIGGEKRAIGPGVDPKIIAVSMMKARRNSGAPRGFNDKIVYPNLKY